MTVLDWIARADALPPGGVVATGAVIAAVLARLQALPPDGLASLSAVAARDFLVILGPAAALPWADGVRYCAAEPLAPMLWLPTHVAPALPADLVQASLARRTPQWPALLWHEPEQLLSLDRATALAPPMLDWLREACL
jgi:hypothetical protein